jgi:hypothetical protein
VEVQTSSRKFKLPTGSLNFQWKFELPNLKKARNSLKLFNLLFYTIFITKYVYRKKISGSSNFQNAKFIDSSAVVAVRVVVVVSSSSCCSL